MGCSSSKPADPPPPPPPPPVVQTGQVVSTEPAAGGGGYQGGQRKGGKPKKWQIELGGKWQDYDDQENNILKRAYLCGQQNCRFHLRGQDYSYDFGKMTQMNLATKKIREIRAPPGLKPPKQALLPTGPMTVITVKPGQQGQCIQVPNPNNPGEMIPVYVPPHAKPGSKMAVPLPAKGENIAQVQEKQKEHEKSGGWSTGGKVAAGGAALVGLGAVGVGGVILGDHLAGGDMAADVGAGVVDAGEAIGDVAVDAGEGIADFAGDAGDWLVDAGEDVGDFIMDLF
jgi:hypothetical protein